MVNNENVEERKARDREELSSSPRLYLTPYIVCCIIGPLTKIKGLILIL